MSHFFEKLVNTTSFDPSEKLRYASGPDHTANSLYRERNVPILLLEQRIGKNRKLDRRLSERDRLEFGKALLTTMGKTVLNGIQ
jgi:hypothetical protein